MPEETHQPQGNRGRSRRERVEIARSRDILDVANELNMELVRDGKDYRWKEHDSLVISPDKNKWNWFSRHQGGDVIALVETIREINFNQAIDYLNDGTFKEFTAVEREKEPFRYHLQPYEQDFVEARNYLKVNRGLSDETIDFFLEKGVLAQANAMLNNSVEPVVVFKTLTSSGEITGATLQGIEENRDKWPGRGFAKNIIRNSDGMDGLHVDIGKPNRLIFTESPIDLMSYYEINKDTLQDVRLVSMDGLKEATIGRHLAQLQSELSGRPLNWTPEQLAKGLQTAIESQYFADGKHSDMITLAVDNDTAGRTFIEELKAKGAAVTVELPELRSGQDKADWNDTLKYQYGEEATTSIEKSPEHHQETDKLSEHQKNERTNGSQGSLQPKAEGSPTPVPEVGTFERSVTSRPTLSSHLLYFTINEEFQSSNDGHYHSISSHELAKLNRPIRSQTIQNAARYYLDELANSKIYYVTPDKTVQVNFEEKHFMHLTGIKPLAPGQTPEKTLHDFAEGNGHFDNILLANNDAAFDKINVLSDLSVATESTSFYFDDLTNLRRYNGRFDSLIKSDDKDIILLFKELEEENYIPVSVFQSRARLVKELETADKTPILAVFRERNGHIEQLSINEDYIKDGGKELESIMKNGLFEELQTNETDKNHYMIRLQWAEKHDGGPILPFGEAELINYQSFAKELYKQNNIYYEKYHASVSDRMNQVEGASYKPFTKVKFDLYSPDGELIQDGIRYNIGEEINPIAHKERLGTREMREYPELMKIDGAIFTHYHLERLASELDISQFSYALEDTPYTDQLLSQLPYGDLENSPIGFTDSSHDGRLGFISFNGMDGVEVENLSAWFEKLGVKDSPMEQVALVEKWQKEIKDLSEKVEQTIENIRDEFEKTQVKNSQNTPDNPYEKIYQYNQKDERDRDLDGDGISNSDEMLQGTDPYNAASNLHKKQEDRERRTDAEVAAGAIIIEEVATKNSEQTISQLVANKDTKALAEHLKEGMKNYLDSEQFKSFLDTMSKFHNYSLNNIHLLKMQNPNVSRVASFNKWKTDFERTVKKGSKALKIWVPYQVKTKISANQNELSFSPSENEMEEKEVTVTRFKLGNVFDISQTEGKELPKAINELTGSVKDYEDLYRAAKAVSMDNQVSISFEDIKRESANGYYSPDENRIVISKGLKGQEHILKTIFHEMAHSDLHRGTNAQYGDDQYRKQELQAESVAYVVANHFGFDTSSYSFGYLAIWAKDKNGFEDMVEQLQVVQKEAKSLIDRMDAKLELVKNKSVTKDKFADKLQQAKEKSEQLGNQKAEAVKQVEEKKFLSSPH